MFKKNIIFKEPNSNIFFIYSEPKPKPKIFFQINQTETGTKSIIFFRLNIKNSSGESNSKPKIILTANPST